jgi:hypothetical protein
MSTIKHSVRLLLVFCQSLAIFHPPILMRILRYHKKIAGWKRQYAHEKRMRSIEADSFFIQ